MKLRFTRGATQDLAGQDLAGQDLAGIADYLHDRNPAAALRIRGDIYDDIQNLLLFPYIGRAQKTEGVRKLVTRRFAYLIYYAVDEKAGELVILNVKHPARERGHEDA